MTMLIFDLDGTLWDASESTAEAWTSVLGQWGFAKAVTADQIRGVAGKPYLECLRILSPGAADCPQLPDLLRDLADAERATMSSIGGRLYDGVLEGLRTLAQTADLFLVSNCNDWYLRAFLHQTQTAELFKDYACHGSTGLPKHENIKLLMRRHGKADSFYVGDTSGDCTAAEMAGAVYVHAEYGFGGKSVQARNCFATFPEIVSFLMRTSH
jgi:phosphoglycolate phosphatase